MRAGRTCYSPAQSLAVSPRLTDVRLWRCNQTVRRVAGALTISRCERDRCVGARTSLEHPPSGQMRPDVTFGFLKCVCAEPQIWTKKFILQLKARWLHQSAGDICGVCLRTSRTHWCEMLRIDLQMQLLTECSGDHTCMRSFRAYRNFDPTPRCQVEDTTYMRLRWGTTARESL